MYSLLLLALFSLQYACAASSSTTSAAEITTTSNESPKTAKKKKKKKKKSASINATLQTEADAFEKQITELDIASTLEGPLRTKLEHFQKIASCEHNLRQCQEQCAQALALTRQVQELGFTDEAQLKHQITIKTAQENIELNNATMYTDNTVTFSPRSACSMAALLRLKELILGMQKSKTSLTDLDHKQVAMLRQLSTHEDADTKFIGKHIYGMYLITKRNQLFGELYGRILAHYYLKRKVTQGVNKLAIMQNFKNENLSSIVKEYFKEQGIGEFTACHYPDFFKVIELVDQLGKITELNDLASISNLKDKELNRQDMAQYVATLESINQIASSFSKATQLRADKLRTCWATLSTKARAEHVQYLTIVNTTSASKEMPTIKEYLKSITQLEKPTKEEKSITAPFIGSSKKPSLKPSTFTPKTLIDEKATSTYSSSKTSPHQPVVQESLQYASRVKRWFNPQFTENKDAFSVLYHTFSPLADAVIMNYGIKSNRNGDAHYSMGGIITYGDGTKQSGIFTLCLNSGGICYHRGIETKTNEQIVGEYFKNGNWKIDQTDSGIDSNESSNDIDAGFTQVGDSLSTIIDKGITVEITDKRNNVTIELVKLK